MIVIIGESASGKTTLQKRFVEANPEYHGVVSYTTRPMRPGEQDGVDYHFVTMDRFQEMKLAGEFAETAEYRGWCYGAAKRDCEGDHVISVLTPHGLRSMRKAGIPVLAVYLYVDRRSRMIEILQRGDDVDEAYRRNISDVGQFDGVADEVDYVIDNTHYAMDEDMVLKYLNEIVSRHGEHT